MVDMTPVAPPAIVPAAPGEGARLLAVIEEFEAALSSSAGALFQLSEDGLAAVVGSMIAIASRAENVAALATADALTRGTVANSTATGAPGWVASVARGADSAVVRRVGLVGAECATPKNQVVAQSLADGSGSVAAASVALREVPRVLRHIPDADRDQMLLRYLSLTSFGPRVLRELSTRIIGQFAPEQLVHDEEVQQQCESVRWFDMSNGLTRMESRAVSSAHRDREARVAVLVCSLTATVP